MKSCPLWAAAEWEGLDFGLAKAVDPHADDGDLSLTTTAATDAGRVMGTAAYMGPEQARGQTVDRRTDVWAFGCVLFEMLTGQRAFEGATVSDTVANVLTRDPNWQALPAETPAPVTRLLRGCLEKDLKRRLRDVGDARLELEDVTAPASRIEPAPAAPSGVSRRTAIGTLAGAVVGAASGVALMITRRGDSLPRDVMRFRIPLETGDTLVSSFLGRVALSPDGSHIACNVSRSATAPATGRPGAPTNLVLVRSLRELGWKEIGIPGSPFFSPDGQWLGILQAVDQRLAKVALSGGVPIILSTFADSQPGGGTWASDEMVYFISSSPGGIVRVPAAGGGTTDFCAIDFAKGERTHRTPHALRGGRDVLFALATSQAESYDDAAIAVVSTKTGQRKLLIEGGCYPRFSPSGHLVYGRGGSLLAVSFDPDRLAVTGQPFTILEGGSRMSGLKIPHAISTADGKIASDRATWVASSNVHVLPSRQRPLQDAPPVPDRSRHPDRLVAGSHEDGRRSCEGTPSCVTRAARRGRSRPRYAPSSRFRLSVARVRPS